MASDLTERRAALRAMLVEQAVVTGPPRVRSGQPEPGRLRMAVVTGAVAVAVVAASVVALQLPGGAFHTPPAGGASAAPTTSDASTPSPPTTQPPVADPTPTSVSTTDAPVQHATPTTTPPSASAPPSALITPTRFHRVTRAQVHAFFTGPDSTGDPAKDAILEQQNWILVQCMAEHGFVYDPLVDHTSGLAWREGLTEAQQQAYDAAMYGPPRSGAYDWRTAGCDGLAVHETGQDHAN